MLISLIAIFNIFKFKIRRKFVTLQTEIFVHNSLLASSQEAST